MERAKPRMRWLAAALCALLCAVLPFAAPQTAHAEDEGYYIQSMDIQVRADDTRTYYVSETLDVYYREARHGILRTLPTYSDAESYTIEDIQVTGAPFEVTQSGSEVEIRIGDADTEVTGHQQYVITYALKHYADYETDGDYLYLNVVGTEWDTTIERVHARILYPEGAEVLQQTVSTGTYGGTGHEGVTVRTVDGGVELETARALPAYEGITLQTQFAEGTFANAPAYPFPFRVKQMDTRIDITQEKYLHVVQSLTVEVEDADESIYLWLDDVYAGGNSQITDVAVQGAYTRAGTTVDAAILEPERPGTYTMDVTYTVIPRLSGDLSFRLLQNSWDAPVEHCTVTVQAPFAVAGTELEFGRRNELNDPERYAWQVSGNTLRFESRDTIYPQEVLDLSLTVDGTFARAPQQGAYTMLIGSAVVVALALLLHLLFGRDRKEPIAVELYPPEGMNSAEVGYVINDVCSSTDVTSLLYEWASLGYLRMESRGEVITLIKEREPDPQRRSYEKQLFHSLFRYGDGKQVTTEQLRDHFYEDIAQVKKDVKARFAGAQSLYDRGTAGVRWLTILMGFVPILWLSCVCAQVELKSTVGGVMEGILACMPLVAAYGITRVVGRQRFTMKPVVQALCYLGIAAVTMALLALFGLGIVTAELPVWMRVLPVICSTVTLLISMFIRRRSAYGAKVLAQILGLRQFILVAEKDRLEALTHEDPAYFYRMLPYAQVLGLTDKWIDQFHDITVPPPSWYDSDESILPTMMMLHISRQMHSVARDAAYVTPSDSGGGGFSGGGGGFGGGGFSGGGSGGGGGSSW